MQNATLTHQPFANLADMLYQSSKDTAESRRAAMATVAETLRPKLPQRTPGATLKPVAIKSIHEAYGEHMLTDNARSVLAHVIAHPDDTSRTMSTCLGQRPASVSGTLTWLINRGLVERNCHEVGPNTYVATVANPQAV